MKHIIIFGVIWLMILVVVSASLNAAPLNDLGTQLDLWQQTNNTNVNSIATKLNSLLVVLTANPSARLSKEQLLHLRKSYDLEAEWRSLAAQYSSVINELTSKSELSPEEQDVIDKFEVFDLNVQVLINVRREVVTIAVNAQESINSVQNSLSPKLNQGWNFSADIGFSSRDTDRTETDRYLTLYQRYVDDKKRTQLNFTETLRWQNSYVANTQIYGGFQGLFGWKNGAKLETKLSNLQYHDKNDNKTSRIDTDLYLAYSTPLANSGYISSSYYSTNRDFEQLPQYTYNYNEYYLYLANQLSNRMSYRYSFTNRAYDYPGSNLNNRTVSNFAALDYNIPKYGRVNIEYHNQNKAYASLPVFGFVEQDFRTRWMLTPFSDWMFTGNLGFIDSRQRGDNNLSYYQDDVNFRVVKPVTKHITADSYFYLRSKDYSGDNPNSFDQQDYSFTLNWTPTPQYFIYGTHFHSNYDYNNVQMSFTQLTNRISGNYYLNNGDTITADAYRTDTNYNIDDGRDYVNSGMRLSYLKFIKQHYLRLYFGYNSLDQDVVNSPNDYIQTRFGGEFSYRINPKHKVILTVERNNYNFKHNQNYSDDLFHVLFNVNF